MANFDAQYVSVQKLIFLDERKIRCDGIFNLQRSRSLAAKSPTLVFQYKLL